MSAFQIPEPVMPTPEQHRKASLQWLQRVQPTLIDQWPSELMALSVPTNMVKIDVDAAWQSLCDLHDQRGISDYLKDLAAELDQQIRWDRKFIRLNSRSPKDAPWPFEVPATISGKEAVHMLVGSMRVMDDLMEFRWVPEQPAYVCLRQYVPSIRPDMEFRCFVKDGHLIAVTHYDYTKPAPTWIVESKQTIRNAIDCYFAEKIRPALHLDTVVFDVAMIGVEGLLLIEINPYGLSDPCHFGTYEAVENANDHIQTHASSRERKEG
ncbi:ATP-grasp domain-containing protein [Rhizobium sp. CFBP 8762]|uniref:ATP-grasp domain-containing protein n=1 Tax=Rhizobium sp. CFBP 8762 TaxID=2775279 RepID=UPI00177F53DD|nr:ATP-grasp domain-containing protein [Rhizobium sp. CFBP 8762]MBD8556345.1 ATP-grasp domain-containing protein [Rhizobium sp. CFBP 8762]